MLRVRLLRFRIAGPILASLAAGLSSLCLSLPFQSSPARPDAASPHHFIATFFPSSSNTAKAAIVQARLDRKSTRLNSSHGYISYAVFCLKTQNTPTTPSFLARRHRTPSTRAHPTPLSFLCPHL